MTETLESRIVSKVVTLPSQDPLDSDLILANNPQAKETKGVQQ
jgi:hypothetical protein